MRDKLKQLGYYWDKGKKVWYKKISTPQISKEEYNELQTIGKIKVKIL